MYGYNFNTPVTHGDVVKMLCIYVALKVVAYLFGF